MNYSVFASVFQQTPQIWISPDPPPTLPHHRVQGAGASAMVYNYAASVFQQQAWQWQPPAPPPVQALNPDSTTYGTVYYPPQPSQPTAYPPRNVSAFGATPSYLTFPTSDGFAHPRAANATVVTTGGMPIVAIVGPVNGGYLTNPLNAAAQGIVTAEDINIDMVGPPLAGDAYGYGTTVTIPAGNTFTVPAVGPGVQVWVNAVTSGHRLTVVVW
jgi:hypothetical protein